MDDGLPAPVRLPLLSLRALGVLGGMDPAWCDPRWGYAYGYGVGSAAQVPSVRRQPQHQLRQDAAAGCEACDDRPQHQMVLLQELKKQLLATMTMLRQRRRGARAAPWSQPQRGETRCRS